MKRFTEAIRAAIQAQNWHGALTLALTMPDVCDKLENPSRNNIGAGYTAWFERWIAPEYTLPLQLSTGPRVLLSGRDCWALRCKCIHEGRGIVGRENLDRFHFITPPSDGSTTHLIYTSLVGAEKVLLLQVDIFCRDMATAVDNWAESVSGDSEMLQRWQDLLVIHTFERGIRF
jgi:hypothetical protein